jgi:DNA/RNA-binding domain of Phe-tRNA-synthetase-like protein
MAIEFTIAEEVLKHFPTLVVYAIRVRGLASCVAALDTPALLQEAAGSLSVDEGALAAHPVLSAWRQAYGHLGVKPSKYRSSIEALMRRAVKGAPLATGIAAVDLYNACSLAACAPLGAYDAFRLPTRSLALRFARPAEDRFDPLGAEASAFPLSDRLAVYASGRDVLCWGFNVRDSKVSALSPVTEDAVFFSEAVATDQRALSQRALSSLAAKLCEAGAACSAVAAAMPSFVLA